MRLVPVPPPALTPWRHSWETIRRRKYGIDNIYLSTVKKATQNPFVEDLWKLGMSCFVAFVSRVLSFAPETNRAAREIGTQAGRANLLIPHILNIT